MRMKKIVENRTLKSAAAEFLAFKRAQKIRERTLHDYEKYINPFIEQSSNSMDVDVLKRKFWNTSPTSPPPAQQDTIIRINTFMRCLLGVPNRTICPTTPSTSWN